MGCRSRDLVLLLLPPAIICAPFMLSAIESYFLELSGGGGEDEGKGSNSRGFVFKPFSFLPLEDIALFS